MKTPPLILVVFLSSVGFGFSQEATPTKPEPLSSDAVVASYETMDYDASIRAGAYDKMAKFIEAGADPKRSLDGLTPLYLAADGDCALLSILATKGVNMDEPGPHGRTPLMDAIWRGYDTCNIEVLLKAGANVNAKGPHGNRPLHYAMISGGDPAWVKLLLEAGAEVNAANAEGLTAMHFERTMPEETRALLTEKAAKPVDRQDLQAVILCTLADLLVLDEALAKNYMQNGRLRTEEIAIEQIGLQLNRFGYPEIARAEGNDPFGYPYSFTNALDGPRISPETIKIVKAELEGKVPDSWTPYLPLLSMQFSTITPASSGMHSGRVAALNPADPQNPYVTDFTPGDTWKKGTTKEYKEGKYQIRFSSEIEKWRVSKDRPSYWHEEGTP